MGGEDEDVDVLAASAALDGGGAGIAGGRSHDHRLLAAPFQQVIEQVAEELEGEVLERQGGAVDQLQHPVVVASLHQGRYGPVAERPVGGSYDAAQRLIRHSPVDKGSHHPERQLRVGQARPAGDLLGTEARQGLGHEQPAIGGKAGENHVLEGLRGDAAGADVLHCFVPLLKLGVSFTLHVTWFGRAGAGFGHRFNRRSVAWLVHPRRR